MGAQLSTAEQQLFAEHADMARRLATRKARYCHARAFDRHDLEQVAYAALADGIVRLRTYRPRNIDSCLRECVRSGIWRFAVENGRSVRIPNGMYSSARLGTEGAMSNGTREFILNGARAVSTACEVDRSFRGRHSRRWYRLRDAGHAALVRSVSRLSGFERQVAEVLLRERWVISDGRYRARLVDLSRQTGLSRRALGNLEKRVLECAVAIGKGQNPRPATTAGRLDKARRAVQRAADGQRIVLAVVSHMSAPEALAAVTIAAGRILAPAEGRLSLADLSDCLRMEVKAIKSLETRVLDQAVRLLGIKGVAA